VQLFSRICKWDKINEINPTLQETQWGKTVPSERRKHFSESVMVSMAVSKTSKTKVHFIDKGTKVDKRYYRETLLQNWLLPDIRQLCGEEFVFQQDGTPSHHAKLMVEFLQQNVPNFIEPSVWPPNSPDINPVNYAVWAALQQDVWHRVPIVGLEVLRQSVYLLGQFRSTTDQQSHWSVATDIENSS